MTNSELVSWLTDEIGKPEWVRWDADEKSDAFAIAKWLNVPVETVSVAATQAEGHVQLDHSSSRCGGWSIIVYLPFEAAPDTARSGR